MFAISMLVTRCGQPESVASAGGGDWILGIPNQRREPWRIGSPGWAVPGRRWCMAGDERTGTGSSSSGERCAGHGARCAQTLGHPHREALARTTAAARPGSRVARRAGYGAAVPGSRVAPRSLRDPRSPTASAGNTKGRAFSQGARRSLQFTRSHQSRVSTVSGDSPLAQMVVDGDLAVQRQVRQRRPGRPPCAARTVRSSRSGRRSGSRSDCRRSPTCRPGGARPGKVPGRVVDAFGRMQKHHLGAGDPRQETIGVRRIHVGDAGRGHGCWRVTGRFGFLILIRPRNCFTIPALDANATPWLVVAPSSRHCTRCNGRRRVPLRAGGPTGLLPA
jgi:hypothetical protein